MVKKNSIPERWRSLLSIGQRVPGSRFIAFKVPLKGATNQRVTQTQKFTPKDLVASIRSQNEELGLIIDLTNTERYYTTKDLPRSVQYVKLHTAGLKIPDDATVHQFKRLVRQFLFANEDNDKLIGVHCTTGINRTGYLICRYLIDVDGWRPLHSITAFASSRGHAIEGAVYIEDLIKGPMRSNVGIDLPPTEEEKNALNSGSDELGRDDHGNAFGDFDARRALPQMKTGDFLADFDARGVMAGPRNSLGDHDLRLPSHEPQDRHYMGDRPEPMYPSERLRRPGDFHPDMENFHDATPRPLMSIQARGPREMQNRFEDPGMVHEGMDYDVRARVHPMHSMQSQDYSSDMHYDEPSSRPLPMFARNKMNNPAYEDEESSYRENEGFVGNEGSRFDPRGREGMAGSYQGHVNERMPPRNARTMGGGPMAERMNPRESRFMAAPINDGMNPRESQYMDETNEGMYARQGSMNERIPQRNTRFMDPQMGASYMEDPRNERMPPRNTQFMEDSMNDQMKLQPQELRNLEGSVHQRAFRAMDSMVKERAQVMKSQLPDRMHPNPARHMDYTMSERMEQRDRQTMESPAYDRMQLKDPRAIESPMYERMPLKDPRALGGPMNTRMPLRAPRPVENPMGDRMYQGVAKAVDSSTNDNMYPRDTQAMQGPMNNSMYPRAPRPMDNTMNNRPYPRVAQATDGSMNEWMQQSNARAVERPVNEQMYPANNNVLPTRDTRPMGGQMHEDYSRSYDGSQLNPSEEPLRQPNRFAPYPQNKPSEVQGITGQHNMVPPARPAGMPEMGPRFPRRTRFHY